MRCRRFCRCKWWGNHCESEMSAERKKHRERNVTTDEKILQSMVECRVERSENQTSNEWDWRCLQAIRHTNAHIDINCLRVCYHRVTINTFFWSPLLLLLFFLEKKWWWQMTNDDTWWILPKHGKVYIVCNNKKCIKWWWKRRIKHHGRFIAKHIEMNWFVESSTLLFVLCAI